MKECSMTTPDTLRDTRIRLNHGSVLMPAAGFGTLIPDPVVTKQATVAALEAAFRRAFRIRLAGGSR
jgi:hypothetical protein